MKRARGAVITTVGGAVDQRPCAGSAAGPGLASICRGRVLAFTAALRMVMQGVVTAAAGLAILGA